MKRNKNKNGDAEEVFAGGAASQETGDNVFATTMTDESNMFGDEKPESFQPEKAKWSKGKIALVAGLIVAVLAVAPLGLIALGDGQLAAGNHRLAQVLYGACCGTYNSGPRYAVAKAIGSMERGEIETGIATALNKGVAVNVNYNLNGGEFINTERQTNVTLTDVVELGSLYKARKDYYTFKTWNLVEYSYAPNFEGGENLKIKLDAVFEPTVYKISYANLVSGEVENPQEYTYESDTFTLKSPERVGYTFVSWKGTDIDVEAPVVVVPQGSHGERAYIANWKANEYIVTMNPDVECRIENPMTVTYDAEYKLPTIEKRGYTHKGWSDGSRTYFDGVWDVANDLSVTPVWDLNHYALKYDLAGGTISGTNPATYTVLSEDITINNPTRFGYSFVGWSCNNKAAQKTVVIKNNSIGDISFKAVWKGNPHKLTLDANGGSVSKSVVNVVFGSEYSIPTPTRTGYTFQGWYSNGQKVTGGVWKQDSDMSAAASWSASRYTIKLDANGGSAGSSSMEVTYDSGYSLPTPTRKGYTFQGWYNGNTKVAGSGTWKTASGVTLVAKWAGNPHVVSLSANGGSVSSSRVNVAVGSSYTLPTPTRKGYVFQGWYNSSTKISNTGTWTADSDMSLSAKWTANTYKATIDLGNGRTQTLTCTYDSKYTLPSAPSRTGYDFDGWQNTTDGKSMYSSGTWTWDKNINVKALWDPRSYTVYLDADGGSVSSSRVTVTYGSSYSLPIPSMTGYQFLGWYSGSSKVSNSGTWDDASNLSLTARWKVAEYTVSFDTNGGAKADKIKVKYGEYITLPYTSRTGYDFAGWKNSSIGTYDGGDSLRWTWDKSLTFEAKWDALSYSVSLDPNGGSASSSSMRVTFGSSYTLPTPKRDGHKFLGWYDGSTQISTKGTWKYAEDMYLTAKWKVETYTLSFDANGGNRQTKMTVQYGDRIDLPIPTRSGYTFMGWTNKSAGVQNAYSLTWTWSKSFTLEAIWQRDSG